MEFILLFTDFIKHRYKSSFPFWFSNCSERKLGDFFFPARLVTHCNEILLRNTAVPQTEDFCFTYHMEIWVLLDDIPDGLPLYWRDPVGLEPKAFGVGVKN
jgi:hypothetical protein